MTSNPLPGNPTVPLHFKKKKRTVTWTGSGLDAVHGERGRTERMVGRESAGLRETV